MAETAAKMAGSTPGAANPIKDFATTHRVKKLLETYSMTAEKSLMGPDASLADETYSRHGGKYYSNPAVQSYKLPPDVELSKTSPVKEGVTGGLFGHPKDVSPPPNKRVALSVNAGPASPPPANGLVTLSRVDTNGYRARNGNGHLTGEMIRQMNAMHKKANSNAVAAAVSASMAYQHQVQMQAVYERALKEKSYLKYNMNSSPSSTSSSSGSSVAVAPVFSARDSGQAELSETRLSTRDIACFEVGGERRCCLPQILNSVLDQISLQAIHVACDELQIYCSTCTPEQLEVLKVAKIIPITASQCGLITKSDAERLCSMLLDRNPPLASISGFHATASPFSFRVQHECFGSCRGIVLPEAYTSSNARCVECLECEGLYSPSKFVCHSHGNKENRTCHWGFDSANWRAYLHLSDDYSQAEKDKMAKTVESFKSRYSSHKRKHSQGEPANQFSATNGGRDTKSPSSAVVKKARVECDFQASSAFPGDPYGLYFYQLAAASGKAGGVQAAAAAAAWSAHYAQSIKEGKTPMAPPMPPPANMPPTNGGSGYSRTGFDPNKVDQRHYTSLTIKASPLPENGLESPGGPADLSPGAHVRRTKSSLADDILAIRSALEGASASAREKTLKTLERLTARLAVAESERDMALEQLKQLQKRFERTEDELHKKRAELREALRNDALSPPRDDIYGKRMDYIITKKFGGLPKIDLKSPARIIEEKDMMNAGHHPTSPTPHGAQRNSVDDVTALPPPSMTSSMSNGDSALPVKTQLRRRSGTPASVRSRESEDLKDRVMSMEAELRALRDELSNRSSNEKNAEVDEDSSTSLKPEALDKTKENGSNGVEENGDDGGKEADVGPKSQDKKVNGDASPEVKDNV